MLASEPTAALDPSGGIIDAKLRFGKAITSAYYWLQDLMQMRLQ
jgi:hypothetical protein